MYSPRRTVLDAILVDAAREAGAEVREASIAEELIEQDGRVAGVRMRRKSGGRVTETAWLVIGADGRNSFVAKATGTKSDRSRTARSVACYAYWEGLELPTGEVYSRDRRASSAWPTNDGLVITYCAWPASEFDRPAQHHPPVVRRRLGVGRGRGTGDGPDHGPGHRQRAA